MMMINIFKEVDKLKEKINSLGELYTVMHGQMSNVLSAINKPTKFANQNEIIELNRTIEQLRLELSQIKSSISDKALKENNDGIITDYIDPVFKRYIDETSKREV